MVHIGKKLLQDNTGFVISAELVLVMTIGVLAMVVGLTAVRDSVVNELNDVSHAIGAVSQSYNYNGLEKKCHYGKHASVNGAGFNDNRDNCDCKVIDYVDVCGKDDPSRGPAE